MHNWISIEAALPEHNQAVLICDASDKFSIAREAIYWLRDYEKNIKELDIGILTKITHWMPLPELPEQTIMMGE